MPGLIREMLHVQMEWKKASRHLSKLINEVRAGHIVVLTENGSPIATIRPYQKRTTAEGAISQLEQEGILRPNPKAGVIRDNWKPLRIKRNALSRSLRQLRDEK